VNYQLIVIYVDINAMRTKFDINSVLTPALFKGDVYKIEEGINLEVTDIIVGRDRDDLVSFIISYEPESLCGNDVCDESEDCSSCEVDCGCEEGFVCEAKQCVKECSETSGCDSCLNKELGEGCDCNDECESDVCWADICVAHFCGDETCNADENHTVCEEDCEPQVVCGDNVCSSSEEDCCVDCGCKIGYECVNNSCITLDECSSNSDCRDSDDCTIDICSGIPKECSYNINQTCLDQDKANEKESEIKQKDDMIKNISPEVPEQVIKNENITNETQINETSIEKEPQKQNFFQKILNWFLNMFR
jgi:hypothetical protein